MNLYFVMAYIVGKSGVKYSISLEITAYDKTVVIKKAEQILTGEGFVYGGYGYCDWLAEVL